MTSCSLIDIYQATLSHIQEDSRANLHRHRRENLKSRSPAQYVPTTLRKEAIANYSTIMLRLCACYALLAQVHEVNSWKGGLDFRLSVYFIPQTIEKYPSNLILG